MQAQRNVMMLILEPEQEEATREQERAETTTRLEDLQEVEQITITMSEQEDLPDPLTQGQM